MILTNRIHFIWLGASIPNSLKRPYRRHLLKWKKQNPSYEILLWIDGKGADLARTQFWAEQCGIVLQTMDLIQWGTEKELVFGLLEEEYFANASALLRLRILYQWGGLYFNFGVSPIALPHRLEAPLGVLLQLQKTEEQLSSVSLVAMGAEAGHELLQLALWEGEQNFQLLERLPDLDLRRHENPTVRYGGTLALTGDIIRPILAQVAGFFPREGYPWSLGLEWMLFRLPLEYEEDRSWIGGEVDHENPFHPEELLQLITERQKLSRQRVLSSILHWAAAFGSRDVIEVIAQVVAPFESYFGSSPKGLAIRYQREKQVVDIIPSM
jgi:hypothetical protein